MKALYLESRQYKDDLQIKVFGKMVFFYVDVDQCGAEFRISKQELLKFLDHKKDIKKEVKGSGNNGIKKKRNQQ